MFIFTEGGITGPLGAQSNMLMTQLYYYKIPQTPSPFSHFLPANISQYVCKNEYFTSAY